MPAAVRLGRARPDEPQFARGADSFHDVRAAIRRVEEARRVLELYRQSQPKPSEADIARRVISAIEVGDTS